MDASELKALAEGQPPMTSLDQRFYRDVSVYEAELERIFMRCWLYAGHVSEIPQVGDWFLYELDRESVIVVRSAEHEVRAMANVCRHRGSRVCTELRGRSRRFTCPYHGWTYDLAGRLRAAAHMPDGFDRAAFALAPVRCEVLEGMIFLNFAPAPAPFEPVRASLGECLAPYGLSTARVAHRQRYAIGANWKLSVENYTECYHCAPAHPEYSRGHGLADPSCRGRGLYQEVRDAAPACGLAGEEFERIFLEAPGFGNDCAYTHYPLVRGHVTGSEDGRPVAPLLGTLTGYFGGCTDFQVGPVTFALAYCDHVVIYAFRPLGRHRSVCDLTWLVRGDAREGRDYDIDRLTWLWRVTTEADKRIIEANARGVNARHYRPGPLSTMERFTGRFLAWYLAVMKGEGLAEKNSA